MKLETLLERVTARIAALPEVASAYSLSNVRVPVPGPYGCRTA